ncbi:MAG: beta-ketoacyl-[acyl-carrier-protein] synthase family protein [Deltaproteobacteria bacterium]|nr:beta-ketoacyl-[acyl-carrier-protein] synthase family protein [Deltaproteobacteria bacterium]
MSRTVINTRRVVITGLGVIAPNAHGVEEFTDALRSGSSGIRKIPKLEHLDFRCQVGGVPQNVEGRLSAYFTDEDLLAMNEAMIYGGIAAMDAWRDAGLELPKRDSPHVHWETGCILGSGLSGMDTIGKVLVPKIDAGKVRRLGSSMVEQTMSSSISAKLSGLLALGNQVSSNSSACNTGTEAIHDAYHRIRCGLANRMLAGGAESSSEYIWGGFDAMRVLNGASNEFPEKASRPMSASAAGFVPGAGSGVLVLESLEEARARGARIYAEVLSAVVNCGGQRQGGSMTAPNCFSVRRCIQQAVAEAGITAGEICAINGHLTGTMGDVIEVKNWASALERFGAALPPINSTKSLIGHCLGAAGSIEAVGAILQMKHGFLHPSLNCEDLHPELSSFKTSVVQQMIERPLNIIAKSSFGFGDVNGCLIFKRWAE